MYEDDEDYKETVPDRSKSDYYCKVCHSYMNSYQMWQSHIAGKRHLKNMKKDVGEGPSKVKNIKLEGERAVIQDLLDECEEPMVGLTYIVERQSPVRDGEHMYHCHLCQGNCTKINIIEHLVTGRHRILFFRHIKSDVAVYLDSMKHLSKSSLDLLLEDSARDYESRHGRDLVQVELRKPADWTRPARNKYPSPESRCRNQPSSSARGSRARSPPKSVDNVRADTPPVKVKEEEPDVLTISEVKESLERCTLDQKIRLCQTLIADIKCPDSKEELKKAFEIYAAVNKVRLLPQLRSLPKELIKRLSLDVTQDPPTVNESVTEIMKGKKSYYFMKPPKG